MKVLVFFALSQEFAPWRTLRSFSRVRDSERRYAARIDEVEIQVAITGMGWSNAEKATERAFQSGPDLCILGGFAGGLRADLPAGELVVAESVVGGGLAIALPAAPQLTEQAVRMGARLIARLLTVEAVLAGTAEKQALGHRADAADMESFPVAMAAQQRGIPCAAIRVISDGLGEEMPVEFNRTMRRDGQVSVARVLGQVARRPRNLPALVRFGRRNLAAARKLARFLDAYVGALPATFRTPAASELREVTAR